MTMGLIFLQLIAGAILRHTGKGLHAHLLGAFLVLVHVQLMARRVLKIYTFGSGLGKLAAALPLLVAVQLILGYISWKTGPVITTTTHVALGALLLAGAVMITVQAFRSTETLS
ncbi:MAG: hypothetical protein A2992_08085 [Elusimicrobia bacterium RIFCSPLOWO2_01_FULL_59_12]|nr:MAG: hypothetical protein A2992_08085 [Elusimicrobia bacterium RIFCSPLOWO2_01_FULL_59_12]